MGEDVPQTQSRSEIAKAEPSKLGSDCLASLREDADLGSIARELHAMRRLRDATFGDRASLFGEPAWDILLDLFHWQERGRTICLSSSCIASASPTSTATRHLRALENSGLIERQRDERDKRRWWVSLTRSGDALMRRYLSSLAGS